MLSNKISIKKNAFLNTIRTLLNLIFPLITFPYVSRILTVDELGKYNFSSSIVSYFLLIAAIGIDKYAIREGTKYRNNKTEMSEFASEIFSINIVSTLVSYVLLVIYLLISSKAKNYIICILIFSIQIFFTTIGTEWLYSIYEEYQYITIRSIIFKIISIFLLFAFVRKPGDYLNYALVTVFSSVGSNILNFINSKKLCDIRITTKFNWKKMMVPIMIIFASNVAIQIYVNSDITMLGYMKDDYTVGIYSVSTKIYNVVKPVLAAALTVSIPRFSYYAGKKMKDEYNSLMFKVSNSLLFILLPAMLGLYMLSKNIIIIIAGQKYIQAVTSLHLLIFAIIFSLYSTIFNQCVLIPYKREKYSLISSCISAIENILLNFILIPKYGEVGAAFTTVLAELTMAVINYYNSRDIIKGVLLKKESLLNLASILAGCCGIAAVCYFTSEFIRGVIAQTIISIMLSVVIYALILLLLKNKIAKEVVLKIKNRIN